MALAFELPEHLPRAGQTQDKSTHILTKVDRATNQSLNASLASSWLAELDSTIHDTKTRISKRIHDDLPAFERQFESSTSVQTRLRELSTNVDRLADSLNDPKTGILPTLLHTLSTHQTLAEQANNSAVIHGALAHLLRIQEALNASSARVQSGELPESAHACGRVLGLVLEAPSPLDRAEIMSDIKKRYRTLNDRVQEQLGDAYARSIMFSSSPDAVSLTILPATTVPPTSTKINLPAILISLAPDALSARLSTLRRDLLLKFVDSVLLSSPAVTFSTTDSSSTLSLSLSSSSSSPLQSLQTLTTFLNSHIFPHLPLAHVSFPSTFHSPITSAILTHLLKPSIPSSLPYLPKFLGTVDDAVRFEESILPEDARDRPIARWVDDVAGHYEKKRRESVLQQGREAVAKPEDSAIVRIEVAVEHPRASSAEDQEDANESGWDFHGEDSDEKDADASGSRFGNTASQNGMQGNDAHSRTKDARDQRLDTRGGEGASDGWGWDDDADADTDDQPSSPSEPVPQAQAVVPKAQEEEDDDPWDDGGWAAQPAPSSPPKPQRDPEPEPEAPKRAPRMAKGLEKFSAKAIGLSASNTPVASPVVASAPKPAPPPQAPAEQRQSRSRLRPPKKPEKQTYLVSVRAKTVLEIAEGLMREGQELMQSNVFAEHVSTKTTAPGQLLVSAAPSVLDLYRALYPVVHSSALASDADLAMRWSNDCRFLSDEITSLRTREGLAFAEDKWVETGERLKMLGEAWFEDVVVRQQEAVQNMLVGAQGFAQVSNAARYEECRSAIQRVLQEITSVAHQWKVTLTPSAYLHAVGQIVDDALFRVMDDVLSLEDIPEADSERLSDLCEMLAPLEELFTDIPGESVVGSHVPLWFKFSYLSWLIKGSIADLSYLFDQGMLVDYEIDELVRLLRALFAETPLREKTITKISKGHPVPTQRMTIE